MEKGLCISSFASETLLALLLGDDEKGMVSICQIRKLYWNNNKWKAYLTGNSASALQFL